MSTKQQESFSSILKLIEDAGCSRHVMVVGSWAEYLYRETGLLKGFDPNIRTLDVDFLVKNLRRPNPAASLSLLAKERGFIVDADYMDGTTKINDLAGLEVEFLICARGKGIEQTLRTNVGVTAQVMRHMELLVRHSVDVTYINHLVTVPAPEAYVVHKMVINKSRGVKAEKDARAIEALWPYLDMRKIDQFLGELSKRERSRVREFMNGRGNVLKMPDEGAAGTA
ncbi:MAG: GSU2403 family nucleotidyltransferase fold protein [Coriobacteriaceae bacterium]|nr:GSU2403 family nucleotidyltransferase fold protein [Coriobacteriaceae bacterium]